MTGLGARYLCLSRAEEVWAVQGCINTFSLIVTRVEQTQATGEVTDLPWGACTGYPTPVLTPS